MGWIERFLLKGKNQPPAQRHGGTPPENTGGNKHGRSNNAAKKSTKKSKGNTGK